MDFGLSEEQEMFGSTIKKFLTSLDGVQMARDYNDGDHKLSDKAWKGLADLGTMGITVSEKYSGLGFKQVDLVPALEEAGKTIMPGVLIETVGFAVPLLEKYGTEEQKSHYLTSIVAGDRTFSIAWLEPDTFNYEKENVKLSAIENESAFRLRGTKTLVVDGDRVDTLIVVARTNEGITLFMIDREDHDLVYEQLDGIDQTRKVVEIKFNDIEVSKKNILGKVNEGWSVLQEGLVHIHAALAASMVGGLNEVMDMAIKYANTREQFGHPIGRYQAIKHPIVEMKVDLDIARSLSYYANWAADKDVEDRISAAYGASLFASEAYIKAASQNVQIHGGIGFTKEEDCHLFVKRARAMENYLGTIEEKQDFVSRDLHWMDKNVPVKG